jgi:putative transposase
VGFIPKYRRQVLYGHLRRYWGDVLREVARQKESRIEEGPLQPDHVHRVLSVPPKYAGAQGVGYLTGKSALPIARTYGGRQRNFVGEHFWARGYFVSTVGHDEEAVRRYMQAPAAEDRRLEQLELVKQNH